MNPTVYKYKTKKKLGLQRMSSFIVEYYANIKCFSFYIKPLSEEC